MNPVIFAVIAGGMVTVSGLVSHPWNYACLGSATIAGLLSMIEALAMFRISIRNDMKPQQTYKHGAYGISPTTGKIGPVTDTEYEDLMRKMQEPPL